MFSDCVKIKLGKIVKKNLGNLQICEVKKQLEITYRSKNTL